MGKKLLGNKKALIAILIVLLLIVIGVVGVLVSRNSQDSDGKKPIIGNEQEDEEHTQSEGGLQIQEDNEEVVEDSSDASGTWENDAAGTVSGDTQSGNDGQTGAGDEADSGKNEDEEEQDDEDTLIDDIIWGDIF